LPRWLRADGAIQAVTAPGSATQREEIEMAKIKSSTKVSAAAAKSRRRTGAKKAAGAGFGNPPVAADRPAETKQARVVRMLQRDGGCQIAERVTPRLLQRGDGAARQH